MANERKQGNQKAERLQNLWVVLWSLTTLALVVLLVLEAVSAAKTDTLVVKEPIVVTSSALSATEEIYSSQVTGIIFNTSSRVIRVEKMRITVASRNGERMVETEAFLIPARSFYTVNETFESGSSYHAVDRVSVEFDGETETLSNLVAANGWEKSGAALMLYAVLLVPSVWLLVVAAKKRYYLFQESKMQE